MYRLKENQSGFDMVDGPLAGRQYRCGQTYEVIPEQYAGRFEKVKPQPQTAAPAMPAEETDTEKGGKKK
jgi:hypothetical protein